MDLTLFCLSLASIFISKRDIRMGIYVKSVIINLFFFVFTGFGVGLASSSSFVSLNHYFSKKRGQAVGLSMAGTGFGLMVMPQLVKLLLGEYGFRWTVVILGALAFNAVVGSCLLQPIKRHLKEVPVDAEMQNIKVSFILRFFNYKVGKARQVENNFNIDCKFITTGEREIQ